MADLRIVCTDQQPIYRPKEHAHIIAVGVDTNGDGNAEQRHTLQQVVQNIDNNIHRYYTKGISTDKIAWVETIPCPAHCGETIIRSTPDATKDNNLDHLRRCSWRK